MSKPYFAKFLPVEGEIKEGDAYRVKGTDKVLVANKYFKEIDQSLLEKVKLFLCSRDIQVNDKVYSITNNYYHTASPISKAGEEDNLIKVIGEILTPGIVENQEFTEKEVEFLTIGKNIS